MSERLPWINNEDFFRRELWAPYHVKNDIDYYDDLCKKYDLLYKSAKKAGADNESIRIIEYYSNKIKKAISEYYKGRISTTHKIIQRLIKDVLNNPLAVNYIYSSKAFPGISSEIQFFRARTSEKAIGFKAKEMLHIPFSKRGITGNYRFSIPGIPSLYLGNTSYACWIELGCPSEHDFFVSPVLVDGTQKILNLAVMTRSLWNLNNLNADDVHCWLKLIILMIATSYVIDEENRLFCSEYIVSQSIMLGCKWLGLDGVAYYSKRVNDENFAIAAINVALFTKYKKGKDYSEICEHIKIDDAYNYAAYKQLGESDRKPSYCEYRLLNTGIKTRIGNYKRQFLYSNTEFCSFDKFLFATWVNKDTTPFGNALS